ncbi:MAG: phospho-N-acetylmuramoyl-pentapeptide-transferase [Verrucomicrobiota bacterium]|nr:MAG: phospho-N-acetylmuramoyl-pentapeptide-transferase [Verrucomicrobiota bacterium]
MSPLFNEIIERFNFIVTQIPAVGQRVFLAFFIALVAAMLLAPWGIQKLRQRKIEQIQRDEQEVRKLAQLHSHKDHIPTMGGIIVVIATILGIATQVHWNLQVGLIVLGYLLLAAVGAWDDGIKIRQRNARGIPGWLKLSIQLGFSLLVYFVVEQYSDLYRVCTTLPVPFTDLNWTLPHNFVPIYFFLVLAGTSNAVNLTDGLDGLATGCAIPVLLFFGGLCFIDNTLPIFSSMGVSRIPGGTELAVVCAAVLGGLLVFLWYNCYPAVVFMGDTGSLALGMLIGLVALFSGYSLFLVIAGGVFVAEALSDILQVFTYKFCGHRRIFKMAPLHHHFELKGHHEVQITLRAWLLSVLLAALAVIAMVPWIKP